MKQRTFFEDLHPLCLLVYLMLGIGLCMFEYNFIVNVIACLMGLLLVTCFETRRAYGRRLLASLVLLIVLTLTNPIFSHRGMTILFYVNDMPVTKEALVYGLHIGCMVLSVVTWFSIFHKLIDTEKQLYLFGRVTPRLSLLLSFALRLIPLMRRDFQERLCVARMMSTKQYNYFEMILLYLRLFLATAGYAMEHSMEMSNSMKARYFGNKKRTSYSVFVFHGLDAWLLILTVILFAGMISARINLLQTGYYYPLVCIPIDANSRIYYWLVAIYYGCPILLEGGARVRWHISKSRI